MKNSFNGKVFVTSNFKETQKLGRDLAGSLLAGTQGETLNVVALYGDLGSGKTTFVQGLAKGLGIKNRIISPTFVIVKSYEIENKEVILASEARPESKGDPGQARMTGRPLLIFYHIDLYRTESEKDLEGLGIAEIINDKNNIVVIEWAEKLKNQMPAKRIDVHFFYENENKRKITFSSGF